MTFNEGDLVEIIGANYVSEHSYRFIHLRARILPDGHMTDGYHETYLAPESDRPDGYGRSPFFWRTQYLRLVETAEITDREETSEMTATTEAPNQLVPITSLSNVAVGDTVQIVSLPFSVAHLEVGTRARVTEVDTAGDRFRVQLDDSPPLWVPSHYWGHLRKVVVVEPTPEPTANGFAVGDRVKAVDFGLVDVGEVGTVTRVNDLDFGSKPNMAVKFDNVTGGGYYDNGEFIVTNFGSFEKIEQTPEPEATPAFGEVGSKIVAKSIEEDDNNRDLAPDMLGVTFTVTRRSGRLVYVEGGGQDWDGWYLDRFKPAEPTPVFAVGDRVRILVAENADEAIGRVGVIARLLDTSGQGYDQPHPYDVRLDNGDTWDVAKVEHVEPAPEATPAVPAAPDDLHRSDIAKIGEALIRQANDRAWCGEYDRVVRELNEELTVKLPDREPEVSDDDEDDELIEESDVYEFTVTRTYTVRARRTDDNRLVEPSSTFISDSIRHTGVNNTDEIELDSDWDDVEITDVTTTVDDYGTRVDD